jgi:hypothetical protein
VASLALEQTDLGLEVVDLLRQELDKVQQVLLFFVEVILFVLVLAPEQLFIGGVQVLIKFHMLFSEFRNFGDDPGILPLLGEHLLLLELELVPHGLDPLGSLLLLQLIPVPHIEHLPGGLKCIQYLEIDDVAELEQLLLLVVFLLGFDVEAGLSHLVFQTRQLLLQHLLLCFDVLLLFG